VLLVGLTGGIGSGKSTVAAGLVARGARLIDADAIVRDLQRPGEPVFEAMVARFGPAVVATDGTLDRKAVADLAFNDEAALADLNAIVHPAVRDEMARRTIEAAAEGVPVILDIPLLAETRRSPEGRARVPDLAGVIVVDTDPEVAVARLVAHRGFSEADARARLSRQASREERLAHADVVVPNDGSLDELEAELDRCWAWIQGLAPA
jgi:dephospho-CoA kinase